MADPQSPEVSLTIGGPAADPLERLLKASRLSDTQRAEVWDAYTAARDPEALTGALTPLAVPDDLKAALWDLKAQEASPVPKAMQARMGPGAPQAIERIADDPSTGQQLWDLATTSVQSWYPPTIVRAAHEALKDPLGTISAMGEQQGKLLYDAREAYEKGQYPRASSRLLEYFLPLIGPQLAHGQDLVEQGRWGEGVGTMVDVAGQLVQPHLVKQFTPAVNRTIQSTVDAANRLKITNPNTATIDAVEAARRAGVRVDVGTATGNTFLQGAQALTEKSTLPGSLVGQGERYLRERGMREWGEQLADDVGLQGAPPGTVPAPTSKTAAAEALREELATGVTQYDKEAGTFYKQFRGIEDRPEFAEEVRTHPAGSRAERKLLDKLEANAPDKLAPTFHELGVMRQIEIELREQPGTKYLLEQDEFGGGLHHVAGTGGAGSQVYHDLIKYAPEGQAPTGSRKDMAEGIRQTLETGRWNQSSIAAREVARRRLRAQQASGGELPGPRLPANQPLLGSMEEVQLPVDLGVFRQQMDSTYDFLLRKLKHGPLYGDERVAFEALDRLFTGPQFERASIVDSVLGDLKTLARDPAGQITALRTKGQGVSAQAVKELEAAVQAAVERAGPEAQGALTLGREATKRKYQVRKALEGIDKSIKNPQLDFNAADAYDALVKDADHSVPLLRRIQKEAPNRIPELGRATLEGLLEKARAEGGFKRGARLWADWQRLGPQTKQILFGEHVQEIDNFMLLAQRFADNPNPSGSAIVGSVAAQGLTLAASPLTGILPTLLTQGAGLAFTKLLYSPKFARLVTEGLRITAPSAHAPAAAQTAALAQITRAMREAGLEIAPPVRVPAAAEKDER